MAHIEDRWTKPGPNGRRIKSERHGSGKRWLAVWDEDGRRKKKAFTVKDAAASHLLDVEASRHLAGGDQTLSVYGQRWLAQQVHQRPSTREQMGIRWSKHIEPALGHLRLQDITRHDLQDAVALWGKTLAPATVRVTWAYLRAMLRTAAEDGAIKPIGRVRLPQDHRDPVVPLTVEQVQTIADQVAKWMRAAVLLGAATGMRSGEIRGLTVDRVTWKGGGASIRIDRQATDQGFGPTKTRAGTRMIGVGEQTAEMLREHVERWSDGLVFVGRLRQPLSRQMMGKTWATGSKGLELRPRSGWHDLRHFHASMLIADGQSPRAVAARLGHDDPAETLRTYSHLWVDDEERAVRTVERTLWTPKLRVV